MPDSQIQRSKLYWDRGLLTLVILVLVGCYDDDIKAINQRIQGLDSLVQQQERYLGNNTNPDTTKWSGLTGNLTTNAMDVRKTLNELTCAVDKLRGRTCGDGGTVPSTPPPYPP